MSNGAELRVGFGPCHEEGTGVVQLEETAEVQIATVHDIVGARRGPEVVQHVHIVQLSVGNQYEFGYVALEVH